MVRGTAERGIGEQAMSSTPGDSDEELLARFLDGERLASEDAFQALVVRHGPRVLRICRHVLDREHDAEDAFQATFLALARNGASIRDRCALVGWLQEVAYRTALKTRVRRSRRRMIERELMVLHPPQDEPDDQGERAALAELRPVLQEEVIGLPDKYRLPVVLSYLEGRTNEEVANLLKWPIGTVKGRLSRGRALLRSRLTRRGVALSTATLLWMLSESRASAADVSADLMGRTLRRALDAGRPPVPGPEPATPGQAPTADIPSADPSPVQEAASPSRFARKKRVRTGAGGLIAASALIFAFLASVLVGGLISSTAYGGRFPDLRGALIYFSRSAWPTAKVPCRETGGETAADGDQHLDQTSKPPSSRDRGRPQWKGR